MENIKRVEVIKECANMVIACWQHYADTLLFGAYSLEIEAALEKILPEKITTLAWSTAAMERDRRLKEEEEEEEDGCDLYESCDECPHLSECPVAP